MGDSAELWRTVKENRRDVRTRLGINCPVCTVNLPKACPTLLLPRQRCRVCGYRDPRTRQD